MPLCKSSNGNVDVHLTPLKNGLIDRIAGYVFDDDGGAIIAIFSNFGKVGKINKNGMLLTADMRFPQKENWPSKFGKVTPEGTVSGVRVHVCGKKTCTSYAQDIHLGEWAYATGTAESDGDDPLLSVLSGGRAKVAKSPVSTATVTPVKTAAVRTAVAPVAFSLGVDTPKPAETAVPDAVAKWCADNEVAALVEVLGRNDVRSVDELAAFGEYEIQALFAAEAVKVGVSARFRMGLKALREKQTPAQGSGWFDDHARELPVELLRGASMGGPQCLLFTDEGVGTLDMPGRGLIKIRRLPRGVSDTQAANHKGQSRQRAPPTDHQQPPPPAADFGKAGPLEEFAATARLLLRQVGGPVAEQADLEPRTTTSSMPHGVFQPWTGMAAAPTLPTVDAREDRSTGGGRLITPAGARLPARPVALSVMTRQAGAIEEEWTQGGTVRFVTAVDSKTWKKTEARDAAHAHARTLDVAKDSGQDISSEAWAEVALRELAALWHTDRYPADGDVADFLRESAMSQSGMPRGLLMEAREFRKLVGKPKC